MGEHGMGEAETARALDLAKGYLEDAENVLWEASARADSTERAADLEALTGEVWRLEHAIEDLKSELREEGSEERGRSNAES